jgi:hypothetical protein
MKKIKIEISKVVTVVSGLLILLPHVRNQISK